MTKEKLEETIESYGKSIYSFCLKLTGSRDIADDLYQDTWLFAVKALDALDEERNIKSYLLSVALHLWKNRKRKYSWRKRLVPEEELIEERDENCETSGENETRQHVYFTACKMQFQMSVPLSAEGTKVAEEMISIISGE